MNLKASRAALLMAALSCSALTGMAFSTPSWGQAPRMQYQAKHGPYYRIKADFTYKAQPVQFNVVVGCNALVTTNLDRDKTVQFGKAPIVYALEMQDGGALALVPPAVCEQGVSAIGPKFRPFMMTFENAKEPWSGIGYATKDAYASPLSVLEFKGASLVTASEDEYREWRETEATKNLVKPHMLAQNIVNPFEPPEWKPGSRYFPHQCYGATAWNIPEEKRLLTGWDSSKPDYWEVGQWPMSHVGDLTFPTDPQRKLASGESFIGSMNLVGNGQVDEIDIYPIINPRNLNNIDKKSNAFIHTNGKILPNFGNIMYEANSKGFINCSPITGNINFPESLIKYSKSKDGFKLSAMPFGDIITGNTEIYFSINSERVLTKGSSIAIGNGIFIGLKNEKLFRISSLGFLSLSGGL